MDFIDILIVTDDDCIPTMVQMAFNMEENPDHTFRCRAAYSNTEVMKEVGARRFDLAIIDVDYRDAQMAVDIVTSGRTSTKLVGYQKSDSTATIPKPLAQALIPSDLLDKSPSIFVGVLKNLLGDIISPAWDAGYPTRIIENHLSKIYASITDLKSSVESSITEVKDDINTIRNDFETLSKRTTELEQWNEDHKSFSDAMKVPWQWAVANKHIAIPILMLLAVVVTAVVRSEDWKLVLKWFGIFKPLQ